MADDRKRRALLRRQRLEKERQERLEQEKEAEALRVSTMYGRRPVSAPARRPGLLEEERSEDSSGPSQAGGDEAPAKVAKIASTPTVKEKAPKVPSAMHQRAVAFALQKRQPGQVTDAVLCHAHGTSMRRRPVSAPMVFSSGNPMIHHDFVDQVMSYNARQEAKQRQLTNVPWPKPEVAEEDAVVHPVYVHSANKCDDYADHLKTELLAQRLLRDHRQPNRVRIARPDYDDHDFPYNRTPGSSRLGETHPQFEMCFLELVKNQSPAPRRLAEGEASKSREPDWLGRRTISAPPRRALVNMPVNPRQDGRAEPVRMEVPLPPNWKESYGRPNRSTTLRWESIATSRRNMALQNRVRLCDEVKTRTMAANRRVAWLYEAITGRLFLCEGISDQHSNQPLTDSIRERYQLRREQLEANVVPTFPRQKRFLQKINR